MTRTLKKILAALVLIIFLPVIVVTIYEYGNLTENEEVLDAAYKNQLQALVHSINTYSYDAVLNWAMRLELATNSNTQINHAIFQRLISENPAIQSVFFMDDHNKLSSIYQTSDANFTTIGLNQILNKNDINSAQLIDYLKNGYRKIESLNIDNQRTLIYFAISNQQGQFMINFVEINNALFLQNNISQRVQAIAQNQFDIRFTDSISNEQILPQSGHPAKDTEFDLEDILWLIPQIKIQIQLTNTTIDELTTQRTHEGWFLLGGILVILLIGVWFLYFSIRRELQLTQIKSEFISNVSHEIRTPLALISMYIETLQLKRITTQEKIEEYYDIISKETRRLTGMVNKILNFSRLESGRTKIKTSDCCLNSIVEQVLDTYEFHLQNKGFKFNFIPDDHLPCAHCDTQTVGDALINLVDNAIKYSLDKKEIEIRTGMDRSYLYVEVKDYGIGIAKKDQKYIFDKFYRVTTGNLAHVAKGTGLGLSIVDETMKAHKGKIKLISKPGEGSTFRLCFPISKKIKQ